MTGKNVHGEGVRAATEPPPLVLFVCQLNIGLSIMAEALLAHLSKSRVRTASAGERGWQPVSRYALECLRYHGIPAPQLTSRPWGEFFGLGRGPVRFLIALEEMYVAKAHWPKDTVIAHWPLKDPARTDGTEIEIRRAFELTFKHLLAHLESFLSLPLEERDASMLRQALARIGKSRS